MNRVFRNQPDISKHHFLKRGRMIVLLLCLGFTGHATFAQQETDVVKKTFTYKDTLGLDFYSPQKKSPDARPLVVFVHGGGFAGGKRDGVGEEKFCTELAGMGYAVASISYRLTRKGESFGCDCPARTKINTFVMASEDLSDAVDFLLARSDLAFDRNKVILAGSSAGAEAVLNTAFMSGHHDFKHLKHHDFDGVISFAGAVLSSSYIDTDNAVPTLMIHGEKDELVPYGTQAHHLCSVQTEGYLILDGSETIASRLASLGVPYILAYDPEGTHDWAGAAFEKTQLVHHFIKKIVEQGEFEQTRLRIGKKSEQ